MPQNKITSLHDLAGALQARLEKALESTKGELDMTKNAAEAARACNKRTPHREKTAALAKDLSLG